MIPGDLSHVTVIDDGVIRGDIHDLPERESKVVRLFVSSTFTDMGRERNVLMCHTFPKLNEYFRKRGFEFQVVDMRWGVREEAIVDHMVTSLCDHEIKQTQHVSRGACFMALLGDKYGSCPLPSSISLKEFRIFVKNLKKIKFPFLNLEEWYKVDDNAEPPQFVLLPLSHKYKYFSSNLTEDVDKRIQEHQLWNETQKTLRKTLQLAAELSQKAGDITAQEKHKYFVAVTESEISTGILEDSIASERTFCILRQFEHINFSHEKAWRYADVNEDGRPNQQSKMFLDILKRAKIPQMLPKENIQRFTVNWTQDGVNPLLDPQHEQYLTQIQKVVYDNVVRLSEARIKATQAAATKYEKHWYSDLIQHAEFCRNKVKVFEQRRKIMVHCQRALKNKFEIRRPFTTAKVRRPSLTEAGESSDVNKPEPPIRSLSSDSILSSSAVNQPQSTTTVLPNLTQNDLWSEKVTCNKPVILHGLSGFGKTSIMAKVVEMFCSSNKKVSCNKPSIRNGNKPLDKAWLEAPQVIKIMRFLGTTPLSCSIRDVLVSIIKQIWAALRVEPTIQMLNTLDANFAGITDYFYELLWSLETFNGKVLIALDAVDQLRPDEGAFSMNWVPLNFPSNVHVLISTLPDVTEAFSNIQSLLKEATCYIEVNILPRDTAENILEIYGHQCGRTLTSAQKNFILNSFKDCPQPMYLKLAFDLAKEWKSFTPKDSLQLGKNCRDLINVLFARLENMHGRAIVWALQYITASRKGLSDTEIEDLLSLDDHVLQDVYIHHLPPEPSVIRLPPMLWRRIRQQLQEYMTEREADDSILVNWYHRQFWETAVFHITNAANIHHNMAQYFSGTWHNRVKPLSLYKGKKAEYTETTRNVPHMPNQFSEDMPNLRKLSELPYHVILSYDMSASADLLTDFHFLQCKLRFAGLKQLLTDFKLYFDTLAPDGEKYADLVFLRMVKEDLTDTEDANSSKEDRANILKTIPGTQKILDNLTDETISVKIVFDLLMMAGDILLKDWMELAAQIVGRLNAFWMTYPRIHKLVQNSRRWLIETDRPLLIPRWPCLQSPGGLLRTNINHVVHIPGRLRDYSDILHLSQKGLLYVRELRWDQQDIVHVYDIENHGEMVHTLRLRTSIESSYFLKDGKYMLTKTYLRHTEPKDVLFDFELKQRLPLLNDADENKLIRKIVSSHSENIIIATLPHDILIFDLTEKQVTARSRVSLNGYADIVDVCISPDEQTAVIATRDACMHVLKIETCTFYNHFGYMINPEEDSVENADDSKNAEFDEYLSDLQTYKMLITLDSRLICRGIRKDVSNRVYVYDLTTDGEGPIICKTGETHPIDILVLHKTHQWAAGATKYDEMGGGVKGRLSRPLYVWDIHSGRQIFRIKGNKGPFCSVIFLGEKHQFLAFSRKFDPGIIVVGVGTPDEPKPHPSQLLKLGGHSKAVCCMIAHSNTGHLITASTDNTIKIWDLTTSETLCAVADKHIHMQKPVDRKTKEDKERYKISKDNHDPAKYVQYRGNVGETITKKTLGGCHAICVAISHDQTHAATGCMFGRVCFFNLITGDFIVVQAHQHYVKRVQTVQFDKSDTFVMTGANEPRVMFWDYKTGICIRYYKSDDQMHCALLVHDLLVVGHHDRGDSKQISYCNIWNAYTPQTPESEAPIQLYSKASFDKLAVTSDGKIVASWNGFYIDAFIVETQEKVGMPPDNFVENEEMETERCSVIQITTDNKMVVVAAFRQLHIADIQARKVNSPLRFSQPVSDNLIPSKLESAPVEYTVMCTHTVSFKTRVCSMQFGYNDEHAFVGRYREVSVIDLQSGVHIKDIYLHKEFVENIMFTGNHNYITSVSQDKTVKLWYCDRNTQEIHLMSRLTFHCPIRVMAVTKDLSYILVGPESAGTLAMLTLNRHLRELVMEKTPDFSAMPLFDETEGIGEVEQLKHDSSSIRTSSPLTDFVQIEDSFDWSLCSFEVSESQVKLSVASGSNSLTVSRESFDSCRSIAGMFTNTTPTDNKCSIM